VLFLNPNGHEASHVKALERIGFSVFETRVWPDDDIIRLVEVVVVFIARVENATMLATRLRAKPHFGRRVLVGIVPATISADERRSAEGSGFDEMLTDTCSSRLFVARLMRRLRARPEYRCVLPSRDRRRAVA
jgi:hypothetical protein